MVKVVIGTKVCSFEELIEEYSRVCEENEELRKQISELETKLAKEEALINLETAIPITKPSPEIALKIAGFSDEEIRELLRKEEPLPFSDEQYEEEPVKINLNDIIKVKLTPYGTEAYYHQYDETNKMAGRTVIEPHMPEIDKDGYTKFQLHHFVNLYGEHIRICNKNVIEPLDIILCG